MIREGLISLLSAFLNCNNFIEAATGTEFIEKFKSEKPEIAIVDIILPDICGIDAVTRVSAHDATIIFISNLVDDLITYKCYKVGGYGFVNKTESHHELLKAIKTISEGRLFFPIDILDNIEFEANLNKLCGFEFDFIRNRLTRTELIIFEKLGEGLTKKRIIEEQFISPKTYEKHIKDIKERLNLGNINELLHLAANYRLYSQQVKIKTP